MVCFHGPVREALPFFSKLGFECPPRKDPASFLQVQPMFLTLPIEGLSFLLPLSSIATLSMSHIPYLDPFLNFVQEITTPKGQLAFATDALKAATGVQIDPVSARALGRQVMCHVFSFHLACFICLIFTALVMASMRYLFLLLSALYIFCLAIHWYCFLGMIIIWQSWLLPLWGLL